MPDASFQIGAFCTCNLQLQAASQPMSQQSSTGRRTVSSGLSNSKNRHAQFSGRSSPWPHTSIPRVPPSATASVPPQRSPPPASCRRPPTSPPLLSSAVRVPPRLPFHTHGRARVRLSSAARLPPAARSLHRLLFPRPGPLLPPWPPPPPPPSPPLTVAGRDCRRELRVRAFPIGHRRRPRWRRNLLRGHRRARPVQGPVGSERGTHRIRARSLQARMFQVSTMNFHSYDIMFRS